MTDLVVTVPRERWIEWLEEGDCAGTPSTRQEYDFSVGSKPPIQRGERLYIVAHGKLRGYAPVTDISFNLLFASPSLPSRYYIRRNGGAVACTIDEEIRGFRGWRKVWWSREQEREFPGWQDP